MNEFLERYRVKLTTLSPVHVGSSEVLTKKEYIIDHETNKLQVINFGKMFGEFQDKRILKSFQKFLMKNSGKALGTWLKENKVTLKDNWINYELELNEVEEVLKDKKYRGINLFQKDAYGYPYIPGSSLKGALRTALLSYSITKNYFQYSNNIDNVKQIIQKTKIPKKSNSIIKKQTKELEEKTFLVKDAETAQKIDIMKGLRVSDSKPLRLADLILCQKIDQFSKGKDGSNKLPILRECVKPGTEVEFTLILDRTYFKLDINVVESAIVKSYEGIREWLNRYFICGDYPDADIIYIGGGSGYLSKTVTYDLFEEKSAADLARKVMPDIKGRVSDNIIPRVMKVTNFSGRENYEMGLCTIKFERM